jgi:predicted transcriptional regulator
MTTKTQQRTLVNAWVEPEDARRLAEKARLGDRSRSAELRLAVRQYLERDDRKETER